MQAATSMEIQDAMAASKKAAHDTRAPAQNPSRIRSAMSGMMPYLINENDRTPVSVFIPSSASSFCLKNSNAGRSRVRKRRLSRYSSCTKVIKLRSTASNTADRSSRGYITAASY